MRPLRIGLSVVAGFLITALLAIVLHPSSALGQTAEVEAVLLPRTSGHVLVRFDNSATAEERRIALASIGARQVGYIAALDTVIASTNDSERSVASLNARSDILWAEPDYLARIQDFPPPSRLRGVVYVPVAVVAEDPLMTHQWHHALIRTGEAWRVSRGAGAIIAIVDTGVDCDLTELMYQCVAGYDFVNDDFDPSDDHGHGTDVASIAAGAANNGIGGVGIAPDSRLMPLKAMSANGFGSYAAIANAVVWAADRGADVINLSLGGYYDSATLRSAISYAVARGLVVVAAAGNDNLALPAYPAAYPNVIAVAATDRDDRHWEPSNRGSYVDVAAPGAHVATTTRHGWGELSGTSEATPIVAGVAALIRSRSPGLSAETVLSQLAAGAVDLGDPGWDPFFGHGRVDAARAVSP